MNTSLIRTLWCFCIRDVLLVSLMSMAQLEVGRRQAGCWVQSCSWIRAVLTVLLQQDNTEMPHSKRRPKDYGKLFCRGIWGTIICLYVQSDIDKRTKRDKLKISLYFWNKLTFMKQSNTIYKKLNLCMDLKENIAAIYREIQLNPYFLFIKCQKGIL